MPTLQRNNLYWGWFIGMTSPLLGFALVYAIFEMLTQAGIMDPASMSSGDKRLRTIILLAICTNIFWIRYYNKPFLIKSLRGVIFATMIMCIFWFIKFYHVLYAE